MTSDRAVGIAAASNGDEVEIRAPRILSRRDARLRPIIRRIGAYAPELTPDPFRALLGSIIHQQVSMSAAASIQRRLCALCPRKRPSPAAIRALSDDALRSAGLSRAKVGYVRGLAEAFARRRLSGPRLRRMTDDDVVAAVTALKGVGRWTAEMLLIFCLQRADVWPIDDLGLQRAVQRLHGADAPLTKAAMEAAGDGYRPYRTVATWYLWRSLDQPVPPRITHD